MIMMQLKADFIHGKKEKCHICGNISDKFILMRDYDIGNLEYRACSENCAMLKLVWSNPTLEVMYKGEWTDPYVTKE